MDGRAVWPTHKPLALRLTMDDFHVDGLTPTDGVSLARMAVAEGVDILDPMSFGGIADGGAPDWGRNFTNTHAAALKAALPEAVNAGSAQTAPDFATEAGAVNALVAHGPFDIVLMGRQLLADPHWPVKAANALADDRLLLPTGYEIWLTGRVAGTHTQIAA